MTKQGELLRRKTLRSPSGRAKAIEKGSPIPFLVGTGMSRPIGTQRRWLDRRAPQTEMMANLQERTACNCHTRLAAGGHLHPKTPHFQDRFPQTTSPRRTCAGKEAPSFFFSFCFSFSVLSFFLFKNNSGFQNSYDL